MKSHLDFLGKRIYLAGEVTVSGFSYPKIYFKIQDRYEMFYNVETFKFSDCTCQHGSFWGINEEDKCKHTAAVRWWVREELIEYMKSQSSEVCMLGDSHTDNSIVSNYEPSQDITLREQVGRNNSITEDVSVSPCLPEMMEESEDKGESSEPLPFWISKYLDETKEYRQ